jgi:hypothetical protein
MGATDTESVSLLVAPDMQPEQMEYLGYLIQT